MNEKDTEIIEEKTEEKDTQPQTEIRHVKLWKLLLLMILLFVITFFTAGVFWALASWSSISMDELIWHLGTSLKGSNMSMVWEFVLITVGSAVLVTGISCALLLWYRKRGKQRMERIIYRVIQIITLGIFLGGLASAWFGFGIGTYLKDQFNPSAYVDDNYVDPGNVNITFPEKKRNLIFIYLESMEVTFMDKENGGAFPENVIPELTELAQENDSFSGGGKALNGGIALPGAVWTMGAIFGTTAGLPLKTPLGQNGMSMNSDFFPGLVTMGDILKEEGYQNLLLMGSDSDFGGCRMYYESHGDFVIHDYPYAKEVGRIPDDYCVWWGYEDDKLFQYAKDELTELSAGDQPFQLVLQTMDTHFEDGHLCKNCFYTFGDNKYANVMNCSSRSVKRFVDWVKRQDFYENTTIVIAGDHPTMDKDFCEGVPEDYRRKTYFCIINPAETAGSGVTRREFSTFDIFPTTLAALGVSIEGGRLGLGTNLYSSEKTLLEKYGTEYAEQELTHRTALMEDMFSGDYVSPILQKKESEKGGE